MRRSALLQTIRSLSRTLEGRSWACKACELAKRRTPPRRSEYTHSSAPESKSESTRKASLDATGKPFYVTTPIFYVNADPHIGHLHSMVVADVIKRFAHLRGGEPILLTGTDEHGMKVQRAAEKAGIDPKEFCDRGAENFKALAEQANVSYTRFMRTTDQDHREAVQHAWHVLQASDLIYKSKHEGWYSVSDEAFYPPSQVHLVVEAWSGRKHMASMETGKEVEWTEEVNYMFRLSAFREELLDFYKINPEWIQPPTRRAEVFRWVEDGLQDLSISRPSSRLKWGVPVPGDPSQTMYVWLEALMNYLTAAGYPWAPSDEICGGWPADVQIIGKDISRFHCVYWPAFLMALDLPLPKMMLVHSHWLMGGEKMSKSTGNVVNPFFAMDRFGVDALRYFLASGAFGDDTVYENDVILRKYKSDLKGQLGNLASRLARSDKWNIETAVLANKEKIINPRVLANAAHSAHWTQLLNFCPRVDEHMSMGNLPKVLEAVRLMVADTNVYMTTQMPWHLADAGNTEELNIVIYLCAESLRAVGISLQPFMPEKASTLLDMLGVRKHGRTWWHAFPKRDPVYGRSLIDLGKGEHGVLFPAQLSDKSENKYVK